jgi:hypothetical protein
MPKRYVAPADPVCRGSAGPQEIIDSAAGEAARIPDGPDAKRSRPAGAW